MAAEELLETNGTHKIPYVASDEKTADESAKIIGEAVGKPNLAWHLITDEEQRQNLLKYGLPENIASNTTDLYSSIHNGKLAEEYDKNKPGLGKTKLQDFDKKFAKFISNQTVW